MINIIYGNLLEAKRDIIGHQVNCMGVMNSGVARAIRDRYPIVFQNYIEFYNRYKIKEDLLGTLQLVDIHNGKLVANLFGQLGYGRSKQYTNIKALTDALINLKNYAEINNKSVALPYNIGCCRGGADWNEVYQIIENIFSDYEVTLYKLDLD